jgi:Rrf2 family protein
LEDVPPLTTGVPTGYSLFATKLVAYSSTAMMKLTKKADYGLIALKHLATHAGSASACDIAELYRMSVPLMAKVLQRLAKNGLVAARHGSSGGYTLARDPRQISALDVIRAIDGPLFITSCVTSRGNCEVTNTCSIREPLRRVNDSIVEVLGKVTILHMTDESSTAELVELGV